LHVGSGLHDNHLELEVKSDENCVFKSYKNIKDVDTSSEHLNTMEIEYKDRVGTIPVGNSHSTGLEGRWERIEHTDPTNKGIGCNPKRIRSPDRNMNVSGRGRDLKRTKLLPPPNIECDRVLHVSLSPLRGMSVGSHAPICPNKYLRR